MTGTDRPVGTLRVATYNLRALQDDARAAARVVRAIDPDVLMVQEIPRRPLSSYQISAFARSCGLLWSGRTRRLAGTSLLTSLRVDSSRSQDRSLPVGLRDNPRGYTLARVSRQGGAPVGVVCVHLPLKADQRVQHVRQVLSELSVDPKLAGLPWVIGGDINEQPGAPAWSVLEEHLRLVSRPDPSFPAASPHRVIDAIFATPGVEVDAQHDLAELSGLEPVLLRAATDHLPVWVDLRL